MDLSYLQKYKPELAGSIEINAEYLSEQLDMDPDLALKLSAAIFITGHNYGIIGYDGNIDWKFVANHIAALGLGEED